MGMGHSRLFGTKPVQSQSLLGGSQALALSMDGPQHPVSRPQQPPSDPIGHGADQGGVLNLFEGLPAPEELAQPAPAEVAQQPGPAAGMDSQQVSEGPTAEQLARERATRKAMLPFEYDPSSPPMVSGLTALSREQHSSACTRSQICALQ